MCTFLDSETILLNHEPQKTSDTGLDNPQSKSSLNFFFNEASSQSRLILNLRSFCPQLLGNRVTVYKAQPLSPECLNGPFSMIKNDHVIHVILWHADGSGRLLYHEKILVE